MSRRTRGLLREFEELPPFYGATPEVVPPGSDPRRFPQGMAGSGLRHDRRFRRKNPGRHFPGGLEAADVVRSGMHLVLNKTYDGAVMVQYLAPNHHLPEKIDADACWAGRDPLVSPSDGD